MKKAFIGIIFALFLIIPTSFIFSACDNELRVVGYSVFINGIEYSSENNTLVFEYNKKINLSDNITVKLLYSNKTNKEIARRVGDNDGYNIVSNLPENPNVGTYTVDVFYKDYNRITIFVKIVKDVIDMSQVEWNYNTPFVYNGDEQEIYLANLPQGVTATYVGNKGTNAGSYWATANIVYDSENYVLINQNFETSLPWQINKVELMVPTLVGSYTYNAKPQTAILKNFDESLMSASRNIRTDAGNSNIVITLKDADNYSFKGVSGESVNVNWQIEKAQLNLNGFTKPEWVGTFGTTYNGEAKTISISNKPKSILRIDYVHYYQKDIIGPFDSIAANLIDVGYYKTVAIFVYDTKNYTYSGSLQFSIEWEISTIKIDCSNISWNYENPYEFNGNLQAPRLNNVPSNVQVLIKWFSNDNEVEPINAGTYVAKAILTCNEIGYEIINNNVLDLTFEINKKNITKEDFYWDYNAVSKVSYDGTIKTVNVVNNYENMVNIEYINDNIYNNYGTEISSYKAKAIITLTENGTLNYTIKEPIELILDWEIVYDFGELFSNITLSTMSEPLTLSELKGLQYIPLGATLNMDLIDNENYFIAINDMYEVPYTANEEGIITIGIIDSGTGETIEIFSLIVKAE